MYDDSLIIVASDHGELLGEHDCYGHKTPMYDPVLRVPLVSKLPFSRRTGRIKARVTLSDIFPTMLSVSNLLIPEYVAARSLQKAGLEDREVVGSFFDFGRHLVLYEGQYTCMDFQRERPDQLYDLKHEPHETNNQIDSLLDVRAAMKGSLETLLQRYQPLFKDKQVDQKVSERYFEELRALGYLK